MMSRLAVNDMDIVWEPSAGAGHLIDAVLECAPRAEIHASELRSDAAAQLRLKYGNRANVAVHHEDALDVEMTHQPSLFTLNRPRPTRIIANPPYGAWQAPERRAVLKRRFPGLYVRETYSTILHHCLTCLSPEGRLVFLIPDTFLWLHRHEVLRRRLFGEFLVLEIIRFSSKFFPGVAFGYSGMCIITVSAQPPTPSSTTRIIDTITNVAALELLSRSEAGTRGVGRTVLQRSFLRGVDQECAPSGTGILCTVGDLAEVRTGFYSGNDRKWLRRANPEVKRSTGYADVIPEQIASREETPPIRGIAGSRHFIPIVRGGAASFLKRDEWYLDWSSSAVSEYTRPGKNPARFQNSAFYFRDGIGVPMVASSRLTASLLEGRLFDQGIVGIFPQNEAHSLYLLGLLNTHFATELLRRINGTANNSANYIKRIPVPIPTGDELEQIDALVLRAIREAREGSVADQTMGAIEDFYQLSYERIGHELLEKLLPKTMSNSSAGSSPRG
ncbi:MAG: hypothetical protein IPK82_19000 [Polyangiaceae bacterium]|nr:hypothetical protein [Polyangiaceae bacterium]